jgi:DNA-binding MarR family transcriptional regulator
VARDRVTRSERIFSAFLRVVASVVVFNQQVAEHLGLGVSDMQFMTLLQLHGPLTPGQLAELSGLRSGTVTGVIDRLETAGFVTRSRDERDRRKVHVTLDDKRVEREVMPLYAQQSERLASATGEFQPRELDAIAHFLELLGEGGAGELPAEAKGGNRR